MWRLDRPEHEPLFFDSEGAAVAYALMDDPTARRCVWFDVAVYVA